MSRTSTPFHPSAVSSSSSCNHSSDDDDEDEEEEEEEEEHNAYFTRSSTTIEYPHVPPRVSRKYQVATLPLTDMLGQNAQLTAAAAAFRAKGPLVPPPALPLSTNVAVGSFAAAPTWSFAEMQVFAQAFFQRPRDWQHIRDALVAHGSDGGKEVEDVVYFFWNTFMQTAVYEAWLRAPPQSIPFALTEQQLYQQELNRREHSGTPPTPNSSSPPSSPSPSSSLGSSPVFYLGNSPDGNGKDGGSGHGIKKSSSGGDRTRGAASPMEGVEMGGCGGALAGKWGKDKESTAPAAQKKASGFCASDAFELAFSRALHEHGKGNWGDIYAAMVAAQGVDGLPTAADEAEACLEEYFRSTYRHTSAYVSYLMSSPAHREQCFEAHEHELPPAYHDERRCSWCDKFFEEGERLVCCESCPNVAHKRGTCAGKVLAGTSWHCETCKRAFKKAKGPEVKEEAMRRTRFYYEAAEAKRRDALDIIIARQAAAAVRHLEQQGGAGMVESQENEESYEAN